MNRSIKRRIFSSTLRSYKLFLAAATVVTVFQWHLNSRLQEGSSFVQIEIPLNGSNAPFKESTGKLLKLNYTSPVKANKNRPNKKPDDSGQTTETISITPIRHIFQYGPPRTASTTQFNIACVALFLHIKTYSPSLLNNTICTVAGSFTNNDLAYQFTLQHANIPQAVKSHVNEPDPRQINNSTYVFATAKDEEGAKWTNLALHAKGLKVGIIQDLQTLQKRGINYWLNIYAEFFSLSPSLVKLMSEYFKTWDTLRQCCGMQMSKYYRNELLPVDQKYGLKPHPICGSIDIDGLEMAFMNTKLYKLIDEFQLMRKMNRPATVDGDLNGSYCSRYNNNVRLKGVPQNSRVDYGLNIMYPGVENHWSEELSNPFIKIKHLTSCDGEQYLFFHSASGFSNQIQGIERAARVAYSTNRTLIMPPLFPHKTTKNFGHFQGRDFFHPSLEQRVFDNPIQQALSDIAKVSSLSNRTEYPSWSEVFNFGDLTDEIGVKIIDLFDFVKSKSKVCLNEFSRQPEPRMPLLAMQNKSDTWTQFIDLFNKQYASHSIALIGNAFVLGATSPHFPFPSQNILFLKHDEDTYNKISKAFQHLPLSTKVMRLLKAAIVHLPANYFSVHLRTGDQPKDKIQSCSDEIIVTQYNKVIENLKKSNATEGRSIYIASNDGKAKECFNNITNNNYNVLNLDDVMEADSSMSGSKITNILADMFIDAGTKHLLLDLLLISMGQEVFFAMINFKQGYYHSTYQERMEYLNQERTKILHQLQQI